LSLHTRIQTLRTDERGFALVLAISLVTLVTLTAVSIMTLTQGEDTNSRRDQAKDGAYQAAEAGTNAYLSNLTENNAFYNTFMAKGEATRTDTGNVAHPNNCSQLPPTCSDLAWSPTAAAWTYKTAAASDTGWYTLVTPGADTSHEYQYLIKVYPPDKTLTGAAQVITRLDVTGRPYGSTDVTKWHTIETMIRPSSLTDFQAFLGTSITYGPDATTTGPIFVGENNAGTPQNLVHQGIAQANLYAEGTVTPHILQNGAKKYDKNTSPTALCKLNNCTPVPFSTFNSTLSVVAGAAVAPTGFTLAATDPTNTAVLGSAGNVDAWRLTFLSNGTVLAASCKKYTNTASTPVTFEDYDGSTPPVCGPNSAPKTIASGPFGIYSPVDVMVSGVVKGTVTIGSAADIIYGGNVTYATNGVDVLGLEAYNNIYIAQWAPDANGSITIWSAQLALHAAFTADPNCNNPFSCHSVCGNTPNMAKCIMTLYGSSAIYGGGSSAISMAGMFNSRVYNYDNNLIFDPPPFFPSLGNAFTILVQREL
jgi:Tfp pilus assembly protein PilX